MSGTEQEPGTLAAARSAVVDTMREFTEADRPRVAGWLNTWAPVDETGHVGPVFAVGPHPDDDLYSDLAGALAAIADPDPVALDVIDVEALYSPALQRLLEVAERIARQSGAATVDVDHVELALRRQLEQSRPLGG
ncbi:hypothetical protein FEK33_17410 [Nocardia asteroides NBRC 15531]|uniref:Clp R domain-containing protein n=1 Tax=Nocardia asteroides NBRC 15531 TaxID=1110697 RepID=U5E7U9_NOCAS|nr:hypothetical protein [Nocardia asteroides]TLF67689.1 hypothetical protein FEK33_17410 [Nocardia asteroides NBRC 15531]UGT50748.1 hypothetical protein LT345_09490 [Nocardia asteroides]SFN81959.1 hypothetical protein SAMN05444423_11526 [Nocardia asteroides]VEG36410.1 Uncharacterised protein [Nocardia asteroides]GAD83400.1 hypothetical protein NCAST_19_01020 [Nocardia asteroides NBRC 15531]